jgi:8-oxo-dGTP diphosphatase
MSERYLTGGLRMSDNYFKCKKCGGTVTGFGTTCTCNIPKDIAHPRNPYPTVDIIIEIGKEIVIIERKNAPLGWALPGGFVDYGESLEAAAIREAKEETGLDIYDLVQLKAYSKPDRDPRQHNISFVFVAKGRGELKAGDDARDIDLLRPDALPKLLFDHDQIVNDYRCITQFEFWKLVR